VTIYTISVFTENSPGVLHRINTIFTRRSVNIESLTVSETEKKGVSRFTIVVRTTQDMVTKVAKQIDRIIEVLDTYVSENKDLIFKEIAFFRVKTDSPQKRMELEELAHRYGAMATYASDSGLVIEKTGSEDEINSLYLLLEPFGIEEFIRSGRIALRKNPRTNHSLFVEERD
jgi:acetolactate synthase-1/3 small subunit